MNLDELPLDGAPAAARGVAIRLIGVGGAGSNAADRLKMEALEGLRIAVVNTDRQALSSSPVADKVLIGLGVTRGLGAGGDPELGREAAESDRDKIGAVAKGFDIVFLLAGMGGGTGSGAAPIVAEIASEQGALVIAFVTMPFSFEGGRRLKQAEEGLRALRQACDAVITLPNDVLLQESAENEPVQDSFARADEWVGRGVKSIWAILSKTGLINLDFAALRQAFPQRGDKTLFALGAGAGENAAADAIASLKLCPLLHTPEGSRKADRLLVNLVGGPDLTLAKVNDVMSAVGAQFGRDSNIIMGAVVDESMQGCLEICVIGTSDSGGRAIGARRPSARSKAPSSPPAAAAIERGTGVPFAAAKHREDGPVFSNEHGRDAHATHAAPDAPVAAGTAPAAKAKAPPAPKPQQDEFGFGEVESRGHFEKTDRNLFDGQDLDVPTYLRKGIKIALS